MPPLAVSGMVDEGGQWMTPRQSAFRCPSAIVRHCPPLSPILTPPAVACGGVGGLRHEPADTVRARAPARGNTSPKRQRRDPFTSPKRQREGTPPGVPSRWL